MRLELYAFEYFDELKKRWMLARYRATKAEIAARYPLHRVVGEPEIREVEDDPGKRFPTPPG
jgi:hypothetical protein